MLVLVQYSGNRPGWVQSLLDFDGLGDIVLYEIPVSIGQQMSGSLAARLTDRSPLLTEGSEAAVSLNLPPSLWAPFDQVNTDLLQSDFKNDLNEFIWKELYLLTRADALLVDANSTNELALYARLLGVPVVAVSYLVTGVHPWLAFCAQATVNSPEHVADILQVLPRNYVIPPEEPQQ